MSSLSTIDIDTACNIPFHKKNPIYKYFEFGLKIITSNFTLTLLTRATYIDKYRIFITVVS